MKTRTIIAAATAALGLGVTSNAAIQTQTHTVPMPEVFESFFLQPGDFGDTSSVPIAGLPQFDPALGTLVDVTINFDLMFEIELYIEAQGILNGGVPHSAGVTFSQLAYGVVYTNNVNQPPTLNLLGDVIGGYGWFCEGFPGDGDACIDSIFDSFSFGAQGVSMNGSIVLDDFIGLGTYDGFAFEFDALDAIFDLDNVGTAFVDINAFMDPQNGSFSITYHYDDGASVDTDGDGVSDDNDNCTLVVNAAQADSDADGIGNACDADINNDCVVNAIDLGQLKAGFFGSNPNLDFNGDGSVNAVDLGILKLAFFGTPGPSGLANACSS